MRGNMEPSTINKNTKIPYLTYSEIILLAMNNKFGADDHLVNVVDQSSFAEQLVIDINTAIEDREIIPVEINKSSSRIGNNDYYKDELKLYASIAIPLGFIAITNYAWSKPGFRASLLRDNPGMDLMSIVIYISSIVA